MYQSLVATMLLIWLAASADRCLGAEPPLLTKERVATLQRLHVAGHPWAKFVIEFADREPPPFGDLGQWSLLAWKMTGEQRYAREAIARAASFDRDTADRNFTRECSAYFALHYLWLRDEMTQQERTAYEDKLRWWALGMLGRGQPGIRTLKEDSDEIIGHYFGLRLIDRALGSDYARQPAAEGVVDGPAMRERIRDFCKMAQGGEWIESSEYNLGTLQLLLVGSTAIGIEEFPEVQSLLPQLAEQLRWQVTPDLADGVQWGDLQEPHDLHLHGRVAVMALICGMGGDKDGKLAALLARLTQERPIYPGYWVSLYRALWMFDPASLAKAGKLDEPQGLRVAKGTGLVIFRRPATLLQVHMPSPPQPLYIDHTVASFGDVRWWSGGEWVIDHPLGYGPGPQAANVGLLSGLGHLAERGLVSAKATADGCTIVGRTKGPRHLPPYYDPPPAFADWTREIQLTEDRLKVTDRFAGRKPTRIDRYYPAEQESLKAALGLWVQVWHAPTQPTETADGFSWTTKRGQRVQLATSAAKRLARKDAPGKTLDGNFHPDQLEGWQICFVSDEPQAEIVTTIRVQPAPR